MQSIATDKVCVGTIVLIRSMGTLEVLRIRIIRYSDPKVRFQHGTSNAEEELHDVSDAAPLGKALLGCQRGDIVTVTTPKGKVQWELVEILN